MSNVAQNLKKVLADLPEGVRLVAVSKYHPLEVLREAYDAGQRIFGESHVQELRQKAELMPKDVEWHFIGHLQSNKVKYLAPFISLIHAVDTMKLLREINRQAERCERVIDVLLELHIAEEETKYGLTPDACRELLADGEWRDLHHVRIRGLMMMATYTDDQEQIRCEMKQAQDLFDELKQDYFADDDSFSERSWGMSHDYPIAIETGATLVRVGTSIFGEREY
ncbi:MAG: YggS family pyridoxal phosphate-dependent enzyme [Prevotella sp.]|nr:YggS family pyridoxal phosphate-dependent enzyme [Prevotella sp.]